MRPFEKYAVTVGGGHNHRYNLSDGVMLKDNHIGAAGGIKEAVAMAKDYAPFVRKIEVETENLDMVKEAVEAGADIIMLDRSGLCILWSFNTFSSYYGHFFEEFTSGRVKNKDIKSDVFIRIVIGLFL